MGVSTATCVGFILLALLCGAQCLPAGIVARSAGEDLGPLEAVKAGSEVLLTFVGFELYNLTSYPRCDVAYESLSAISVMQNMIQMLNSSVYNVSGNRSDHLALLSEIMTSVIEETCLWSDDLKKFKSPCTTSLRTLLYTKCLPWLRNVTGIDLTDNIDMTCSKYDYTDTLLCHDDELEGRRIAYIYYLVPEWTEKDGGTLDLFDVDEHGQPMNIVKSILPVWNTFIFFEVNATSFHQVAEILSPNKSRVSVNGWFHGPPTTRPPPYMGNPPLLTTPTPAGLEVLSDWVNPYYLDVGVQSRVQDQFETESQIELPNFLLEDKYKMMCEELENSPTKWVTRGPPNKRHIHIADGSTVPLITKRCLEFLHSEPFCRLLAHLTGLELAENIIKPDLSLLEEAGTPSSALLTNEETGESSGDVPSTDGLANTAETGELSGDGPSTDGLANTAETGELSGGGPSTDKLGNKDGGQTTSAQAASQESNMKYERKLATIGEDVPVETSEVVNADITEGSHPVALCGGDLFYWQPGDYVLATDSDQKLGEYVLDAILYFCCEGWSADFGGMTSYIAKDEDEELLSISPSPNALSLIYRDQESLQFTKYINHRATDPSDSSFCSIAMVYKENKTSTT